MENWKSVVGYEGIYEVSDQGKIRSVKSGRILKPGTLGPGYQVVGLNAKGRGRRSFLVHRLVIIAFGSAPPPDRHQCAHWDGNPRNNHFSNLRWATPKENSEDKVRHGTNTREPGITPATAACTAAQVAAIRMFPRMHGSGKLFDRFLFDQKCIVEPIVRRFSYKSIDEANHIGTPEFQAELDRLYETLYHTHWHEMNAKGRKKQNLSK